MKQQSYEFIDVSNETLPPPITLMQTGRNPARLIALLLMAAFPVLIVTPQFALATLALAAPEVRDALLAHPLMALELALAFAFWVIVICWPLLNILKALICRRIVDIRNGEVCVLEATPFATKTWRLPLTTYEGIARMNRSSLTGAREVAVLVHPNPDHSITLRVAEHIGDKEIRELGRALALPVITPDRFYNASGRKSDGRTTAEAPLPSLA
jgi:hypothetical protein